MQLLKHLANAMQRAEGFVLERALVEIVGPWFSIFVVGTGSIPRLLTELYGRIISLEFESLGMSVAAMYHF